MTELGIGSPAVWMASCLGRLGFVGAYTTFSTFAYETLRLAEHGAAGSAMVYVLASVLVGVAAAWSGTVLGKAL